MVKLEPSDLVLLMALNALPEGRGLIALLERDLALSDEHCRTLEGAALHRAQGRSQFLAELIDRIRTARSTLKTSEATSQAGRQTVWERPPSIAY